MTHAIRWSALVVLLFSLSAWAAVPAEKVPTFQWRARVVTVAGEKPEGAKFSWGLHMKAGGAESQGDAWSAWTNFDLESAKLVVGPHSYPNMYMRDFPVVLKLGVRDVKDPTVVEVEARFEPGTQPAEIRDDAPATRMRGELMGGDLGMLVWREKDGSPRIATMAEYNHRYWDALKSVEVKQRPKLFPIVDRFIGGDGDRTEWREGVEQLSKAGFSAIMLPPDAKIRQMLLDAGERRTAWAIYSPPGLFGFDPKEASPEAITKWAQDLAKPYADAGYAPNDMSMYALSDEPGWYYPSAFKQLEASEGGMERFRDYLQAQGLKPEDVGVSAWDQVKPLGRSAAKDLPSKRLFYWTMRFFAWESSNHYANATRAMETAFYKGMPIFTNWNFFAGRLYVPGPVANNADKQSPDAAMGGHDWLEFGRLRGGTMLWTEDWFGDAQAYQWSFYCAKMRSAAQLCETGDVEFGGYVIPRTAGQIEDGIVQKIAAIVGHGGKAIKYFVFGPEYNFPGNCYSENIEVLPEMAEAHGMIGAAEELLWPGRPVAAKVGILHPRSAQMWDQKNETIAEGISDATNTNLNGATVDYMGEVFNLYTALQHANIPADFVDEDDLTADKLGKYKVLYVTEPNIPVEGQRGLAEWVKRGGLLVTTAGAASHDRYDEPTTSLADATGIKESPRERVLVPNLGAVKETGTVDGELGKFTAYGPRSELAKGEYMVGAKFGDGSPAIVRRKVGDGQVVHFAFCPGLSYAKTATFSRDKLPTGWSEAARKWIVWPVRHAGVEAPVKTNRPLVETPLLVSDTGAVVTVLNWTNERIEKLEVTADVPFKVTRVESVKHGNVKFRQTDEGVAFTLPAGAADFVMLRP